ncbi:MAG: DUF2061 domain-containing protein [Verrucomicrobia subdivision 3 bacterium]|nr:DUF2061 domain-containing protein [Limisphaerales bacterium]
MDADKLGTDSTAATEVIRESRLRSVLKGLSWRILATLITALIAYFWSKDVRLAIMIALVEFPAKFLIYYLHERAWAQMPLGTVRTWVSAEKS